MADQENHSSLTEPKLTNEPQTFVESSSSAGTNIRQPFSSPDTRSNIPPETQPSSSSSSPAKPTQVKQCHHCKASESETKPLRPCSKCQSARYCSRDCQKAGWKVHKKTCAKDAQVYAAQADLKPAPPPRVPKKEGHRGGLQKWQFDT